jgi:hypothetical protein
MKEQRFTTNHAPDPIAIYRQASCCACGHPMRYSMFVNLLITNYRQTWQYPAAGNIITKDGRNAVSRIDEYPWPQPKFHDLLGSKFLSHNGEVGKEAIEGKYLGLFL